MEKMTWLRQGFFAFAFCLFVWLSPSLRAEAAYIDFVWTDDSGIQWDCWADEEGTKANIRGCCNWNGAEEMVIPTYVYKDGRQWKVCSVGGFDGMTTLKRVHLPEQVELNWHAFENCTALESINLSACSYIGDFAFMGCKNLRLNDARINESGLNYPFTGSGIESITIGANVDYMSDDCFSGCENLKEIRVEEGNKWFFARDGVLYRWYPNLSKFALSIYPAGKSYAGIYTVPDGVSGIGSFAFDSCQFTEIHFPQSVTEWHSSKKYDVDIPEGGGLWDGISFPLDFMKNKCTVYLVKNSGLDADYVSISVQQFFNGNTIKYEKGKPAPVKYVLCGGKNHPSNPKAFYGGDTITLEDPTRKGYTFLGWKSEGYSGYVSRVIPTREKLVDGITFTAEWVKNEDTNKPPKQVGKLRLGGIQSRDVTASWSKLSEVTGYHVLVSTNKNFKSGKKSYYFEENKGRLDGLKAGRTYYVKVRAYRKAGKQTTYGKYSKVGKFTTISVGKVKSVKAKRASSQKITVTASAVKKANGYVFEAATDKKFIKNYMSTSSKKRTASFKKLKKGKTYYVRACAYRLNDEKSRIYGAFSKPVKIKL